MCAIVGLLKPGGSFDPAEVEARLKAAVSVLAHRGPDASAVRLWPQWGLGLGHRRLAILDLAARANQPMGSADGNVWIVYNGEIYNFEELRAELEGDGRKFATLSDTEVLISGYQRWGLEGLLKRAVGMFAFALYDHQKRRFFLVRDRAGEKPLYYAEAGGGIYFSSEIRGLLKIWPRAPELSGEGLGAFMALKFVPSPGTLIAGVAKVIAGCYVEFSGAKAKSVRYWSPLGGKPSFHGDPSGAIDQALDVAARRCLVSDVPVGLYLSGGIDSGLLAAKAAQAGASQMAAYTLGYEDMPGYNEFEPARLVAERFAMDQRQVRVNSRMVLEVLQDDALVLDDPITDWVWVPLHFLSLRARADGLKVVLLGEGSDELFFGYDAMARGLSQIETYSRPLRAAGARWLHAALGCVMGLTHHGHQRFERLRRAALGLPIYWGSSLGFPRGQYHQWAGLKMAADQLGGAEDFIRALEDDFRRGANDPEDAVNWICYVEFRAKMSETLLHRVDRVTMLSSLESRAPFLDRDLVELAFSIAGSSKIPGGRLKGLLKEVALRHLPPEVVRRKKMGFSFPFKEWLRGELGPVVEAAFESSRLFKDGWVKLEFCRMLLREHRGGRIDHAPRLWMLYSLCRWYDRWIA